MRDVDLIIESMKKKYPFVRVQQLKVTHPGDDDGIWYFEQPDSEFDVQIESSQGMCPFLVETHENEERYTARTIEEVIRVLVKLLHL